MRFASQKTVGLEKVSPRLTIREIFGANSSEGIVAAFDLKTPRTGKKHHPPISSPCFPSKRAIFRHRQNVWIILGSGCNAGPYEFHSRPNKVTSSQNLPIPDSSKL